MPPSASRRTQEIRIPYEFPCGGLLSSRSDGIQEENAIRLNWLEKKVNMQPHCACFSN